MARLAEHLADPASPPAVLVLPLVRAPASVHVPVELLAALRVSCQVRARACALQRVPANAEAANVTRRAKKAR